MKHFLQKPSVKSLLLGLSNTRGSMNKTVESSQRWPGDASIERTSFGGLPRAALMARVKSSGNRTTELKLASLLESANVRGWRRGYPLYGKPDFVWRKERVAVFVDGCFWHGHDCRNLSPKKNAQVWAEKIEANRRRDSRTSKALLEAGWKVVRIWECDLRKRPQLALRSIQRALSGILQVKLPTSKDAARVVRAD